jgi:trigger factor
MKTEITKTNETDTTIKVALDANWLNPVVKLTFDRLRPRVKAPGFRPGKAPDHIVERELGSQVVQAEVLEAAVARSYTQALRDHTVPAVGQPEVNINKFVPYDELEYTATVAIMPKISLADYKKLKLKRPETKVNPAEIEGVIEDLRLRLAERQLADRASQDGDELKIDFEGRLGGQPVAGASAKDYLLRLGSKAFVPGFEEALIGLSAEQEKTFTVTFPQDYSDKALAGQPVEFTVIVKQVKSVTLPAVNDALAAKIGFKTLDELKADVNSRMEAEKADAAEQEYENKLLKELLDKSQIKPPQPLVRQQLERLEGELSERLAQNGLTLEKYCEIKQFKPEQLHEELTPEAERRVKLAMALSEVAKAENLKVDESEIAAEISRLKAAYHDKAMQAELSKPSIREDVYNHLLASKTIAKLKEYAGASDS